MFPLIKLAKKLKDDKKNKHGHNKHRRFPLIKLAKKLKEYYALLPADYYGKFPLIKLAKKLKDVGTIPGEIKELICFH